MHFWFPLVEINESTSTKTFDAQVFWVSAGCPLSCPSFFLKLDCLQKEFIGEGHIRDMGIGICKNYWYTGLSGLYPLQKINGYPLKRRSSLPFRFRSARPYPATTTPVIFVPFFL